jgi:thiamine-triphosphatase
MIQLKFPQAFHTHSTASSIVKARITATSRLFSGSMPVLEVEEKFSLMNRNLTELEGRLRELGFVMFKQVNMVDWYFDTAAYDLLRHDNWLRCRETATSSQWQLKRGQTDQSTSNATVYEEVEGVQAVELACSLLSKAARCQADEIRASIHSDHSIPVIPISYSGLTPFARILTQRSSWKVAAGRFRDLTVDLDATDFEYAVGEVEAVVEDAAHVDSARRRIKDLIHEIGGASDKAAGKLEYYLQTNRPDIYQICIVCRVL